MRPFLELSSNKEDNLLYAEGLEEVATVWDYLLGSYNPPLWTQIEHYESYKEKLAENATTLCVTKGSDPLGAISFYMNDETRRRGFVTQLAVHNDSRGSGYGTALLNAAQLLCTQRGMTEIRLEVSKDNASANQFYLRNGFKEVGANESSSIMGKALR